MALPELIEIIPLDRPVQARITVPGSKSITNRALILGALGEGETTLRGALWSEDTQVMVECLQELGFMINVGPSPDEASNRTITIYGRGGTVPPGGTERQPLELFAGNAGTAARFLSAFLCLGKGVYRLSGVERMGERPQGALFQALRELGYRLNSPNDKLPVVIHGGGPRPGKCRVSIEESSQFASALILGRSRGLADRIVGQNAEESPYVAMTFEMAKVFPKGNGAVEIDPDASSAGYFWAADWLLGRPEIQSAAASPLAKEPSAIGNGPSVRPGSKVEVVLQQWFNEGWQVDARFPRMLHAPPAELSRERDLGDSIMMAIVLAPFRANGGVFTGLGRLRVQECERVAALRTELARCGAEVVEWGDCLRVARSCLHGAEIETYNDHRMAMCFAILGLKIAGIKIKNPRLREKDVSRLFSKTCHPAPQGIRRDHPRRADRTHVEPRRAACRIARMSIGMAKTKQPIVIAIDGTSASGKSTNAKLVAKAFNFTYVDTGAMYRTLAWHCLRHHIDVQDAKAVAAACRRWKTSLEVTDGQARLRVEGYYPAKEIRTAEVSAAVPHVAAAPKVRQWMKQKQRECIRFGDLVMEGRDIGTNVFPETDFKYYLDAQLEERSRRRAAEGVRENLAARDRHDSQRAWRR